MAKPNTLSGHASRKSGARPYRYTEANSLWARICGDLAILSGDRVGPSDVTWQDVAGTLAVNLTVLAARIEQARLGNVVDGPAVFPAVEPDEEIIAALYGNTDGSEV